LSHVIATHGARIFSDMGVSATICPSIPIIAVRLRLHEPLDHHAE
jgi:hypothetical protein